MSKAGIVIGTYNYPKLVELQLKVIRDHCGDVPVLICDDDSPGSGDIVDRDSAFEKIFNICRDNNAAIWSNPDRLGHVGGDLVSYYVGLQWAKALGLDVLCKLSQRLIIDKKNWLSEASEELLASGLATGCQPCREGGHRLPLRTEAILMRVDAWHRMDVLLTMRPRQISRIAAEFIVMTAMHLIETNFHRWSIFQENRNKKDKDVIWHCSANRAEYEALASRYGLELDKHFNPHGSHLVKDYF